MLITAVPAATSVRTMAPLQSTAVQCGNVARLRYIVSFRVGVRVQDSVVRVHGLRSRVMCLGSRVSGCSIACRWRRPYLPMRSSTLPVLS